MSWDIILQPTARAQERLPEIEWVPLNCSAVQWTHMNDCSASTIQSSKLLPWAKRMNQWDCIMKTLKHRWGATVNLLKIWDAAGSVYGWPLREMKPSVRLLSACRLLHVPDEDVVLLHSNNQLKFWFAIYYIGKQHLSTHVVRMGSHSHGSDEPQQQFPHQFLILRTTALLAPPESWLT